MVPIIVGDPRYNVHVVDSWGKILASSVRQPFTGHKIQGHMIGDVLEYQDTLRFMGSLTDATRRMTPKSLTYRVHGTRFAAVIDPVDSQTAYVHQLVVDGSVKAAFNRLRRVLGL